MENALVCAPCLDGIKDLADGSVDMVFADLPYEKTQNKWDILIPFEELWVELNRVCKKTAAMVFTGIQPFTSLLICSNIQNFRYEMVWKKNKSSGFLNAKVQPLRAHENVVVFYRETPVYTPQMTFGHKPGNAVKTARKTSGGVNYGAGATRAIVEGGSTTRYPISVLEIPVVNNDDSTRIHPTQKPEALVAWFVKTYTKPGDLILDPTAGSGTSLVAAKRLGRRYVGFDTDADMVEKAMARINATIPEVSL